MRRALALVLLAAGVGAAWGLLWGALLFDRCAPAPGPLAASTPAPAGLVVAWPRSNRASACTAGPLAMRAPGAWRALRGARSGHSRGHLRGVSRP